MYKRFEDTACYLVSLSIHFSPFSEDGPQSTTLQKYAEICINIRTWQSHSFWKIRVSQHHLSFENESISHLWCSKPLCSPDVDGWPVTLLPSPPLFSKRTWVHRRSDSCVKTGEFAEKWVGSTPIFWYKNGLYSIFCLREGHLQNQDPSPYTIMSITPLKWKDQLK